MLDYTSLKTCFEVSLDWRKILKSKSFQKKAKDDFAVEIAMDGKKLVEASTEGNTEVIIQLLSTDFLDINLSADSLTPLLEAANEGKVDAVKLLLDRGADLNITDERGDTPLHYAAHWAHNNVIH